MKTGLNLTALAQEIERRAAAKKDFVAPTSKLGMDKDAQLCLATKGEQTIMPVNSIAHAQIAEHAGIPKAYYDRMLAENKPLLATNVNQWFGSQDMASTKRMVRTLDGTARALVSDKFRTLENEDLAQAILPVLLDGDYMILSSEITERRMYIKAVHSKIQRDVPTGRKIGDGSHVFFDTVSPGITIGNSEVGMGSLFVESSIYTHMCTNLATMGKVLRKSHTGSRAAISDDVYAILTDETKRASDVALWGQVRDLVAHTVSELRFAETVKKLTASADDKLVGDDISEVVEVSTKRLGLIESERKGVLQRLIEFGSLTRYGLHAAITRHSADVESYDRATELERIGGEVIEMNGGEWGRLLKAA